MHDTHTINHQANKHRQGAFGIRTGLRVIPSLMLVALFTGTIPFSAAQARDDHGNRCIYATNIGLYTDLDAMFETARDRDTFRVQVPYPGTLTVWTENALGVRGFVKSKNGRYTYAQQEHHNIWMPVALGPGTYCIKLRNTFPGARGYTLKTTFRGF